MRHIRVAGVAAVLILLSGCSSTITAWKSRPFAQHTLGRPEQKGGDSQLYILTAERRVAVLIPENWDKHFCAESLPEAALALSATSSADLSNAGNGSLNVSDEVRASLLQTFTRTERAEILRQMGWQLCQAWAQNVLSDVEYKEALYDLVDAGLSSAPSVAPTNSTTTATKPSDQLEAAHARLDRAKEALVRAQRAQATSEANLAEITPSNDEKKIAGARKAVASAKQDVVNATATKSLAEIRLAAVQRQIEAQKVPVKP